MSEINGSNSAFNYTSEDVAYNYDDRGQLTGVDYVGNFQTDESYDYDANGNREGVTNDFGTGDDYDTDPGEEKGTLYFTGKQNVPVYLPAVSHGPAAWRSGWGWNPR